MSRSLLQNVYLFKSLSPEELGAVSELAVGKSYNRGDSIFLRGEKATAMYLIKFGSVKIQQTTKSGDNLDVATLGTGSHFGEMGFSDGEPRSATAVAAENVEIVEVPYEKLRVLLDKNPAIAMKFYRELSLFLCGRLRATTNDLGFAREKNLSHF
ncbi:MAG TPA: cyclic nucleotide-binding domain-containing protein [Bdellovibrionales bacterium]|nr:cyclic nucleotide-binding domain-containing protein [Bdellovibrionales bacterium]